MKDFGIKGHKIRGKTEENEIKQNSHTRLKPKNLLKNFHAFLYVTIKGKNAQK